MIKNLNDKDYRDPECDMKMKCDCCNKEITDEHFNKGHFDAHIECIKDELTNQIDANEGWFIDEYSELNFELMTTFESDLFIEKYVKDCLTAV